VGAASAARGLVRNPMLRNGYVAPVNSWTAARAAGVAGADTEWCVSVGAWASQWGEVCYRFRHEACFPAARSPTSAVYKLDLPAAAPPPDLASAALWGHNYIGLRRTCLPLASDYSLGGGHTPLDKLAVRTLTRLIYTKNTFRPPSAIQHSSLGGPLPLLLHPTPP
jgi:hypothetical protein